MRKKFIQLITVVSTIFTFEQAQASADVVVCAVPQVYSALESAKDGASDKFETYYAPSEDLTSRIANNSGKCSIVVSSDEKLAILMLRAEKTTQEGIKPFVKAPLILWSKDEYLFKNDINAIKDKKLKSLALPKATLTPVGFAASQIVKKKNFPTDYIKYRLFRTEHEYQAYAMVNSGNVQTGFFFFFFIMKDGKATGSYWFVPHEYYDPIKYYLINTNTNSFRTKKVYNYLLNDSNVHQYFIKAGFEELDK